MAGRGEVPTKRTSPKDGGAHPGELWKGGADGMTEQEVSVRLTENDERLRACSKRLEAVERRQDALDKLVTAVEVLAVRQEGVEGNVREIRSAVQSIVEKPAKRWEAVVDRVLYLLLGAVFSLLAQEVGL